MAKLKDGFYKLTASSIGSDLLVLLAGGGAKPIADFATTSDLGNYLPLSGGMLSNTVDPLIVRRLSDNGSAYIRYNNNEGQLGTIGVCGSEATFPYEPYFQYKSGASYKLYHSGNLTPTDILSKLKTVDGEGSGLDADTLDGLQPSELYVAGINQVYQENINFKVGHKKIQIISGTSADSLDNGFPTRYVSGLSVISDYVGWQMVTFGGSSKNNPYFRKLNDTNVWSDWKQLAFLTDNVASATKLQTARTIWGQSFDGSGDVSGNMTGVGNINMTGDIDIKMGDTDKFVIFDYDGDKTAGASWRVGCLGSGSSNTNYFVIDSGTSGTSKTAWNRVMLLGMDNYDATFTGLLTAKNFVSGNGINDFSAGTVKLDVLNIPTSSGGTTFGPGSNGQVLKSNGTTVYWASDNNSNSWRAIQVNGTQIAGTGTGTYALNFVSGTGITVAGTAGSSSAANKVTITNAGVRSVTINGNYLRVNTNGTNTDLTIPYAITSNNGVFYIEGEGTTAGTWLGSHTGIGSYYKGLTIAYKIPIAGASTTTLNINSLGAKTILRNASALTTHLPVGSVVLLVYDGTYFKWSDYDANSYAYVRLYLTDTTATEYPLLFRYSTDVPTSYVTLYTRYDSAITVNPSTNTITASLFKGSLGDGTITIKPEKNNEVNFGGTNNSATIYFGYRATDSKPIPTKFVFGSSTGTADILANKFIKKGGTSTQFLKADGSIDSSTYLTTHQSLANYVTLNSAQTISGVKTFSTLLKFTVAKGTAPFTVTSTTKVTNLNSDMVDGYHISTAGTGKPWGTIVTIGLDGVSEMGRYIDFHYDNTTGSDYSTRLLCGGNHSNSVTLPSATGTLALTSLIPTVTNYYWANVKVSSSSSTTTTPTFSTATATTSVTTPLVATSGVLTLNGKTGVYLKYNNSDAAALVLTDTFFKPFDSANNKLSLGTSNARWSALYSGSGHFTGGILLGTGGTYDIGTIVQTTDSSLGWLFEGALSSDSSGASRFPITLTWRGGYSSKGGLQILDSSHATLGGNTIIHAGNWPSYIGGDGYVMRCYVIDARSLNTNTWYPVTMDLGWDGRVVRIEVRCYLLGNKPSWATHNSGFTTIKVWETNGYGWGSASGVYRTIYQSNCSWCDTDPVRGIGLMGNSNQEFVYVRGGGYYYFYTSHNTTPILRTSTFSQNSESIGPTTSTPAGIGAFATSYNMHASHFYENSDIRFKDVEEDVNISSLQLSKLPLFNFKWNNKHDNDVHTGSSALEVQKLLPTIVHENNDMLTLDYGVLGTVAGITACRELTKHEQEIQKLQNRISELEEKIEDFKNKN